MEPVDLGSMALPWTPRRSPAAVIPMPVTAVAGADGHRAVFGVAGRGWRYDFRIVQAPYERDGQFLVDVSTEAEWYRQQLIGQFDGGSEALRERLTAPRRGTWPVLAERVWVEVVGPAPAEHASGTADAPPTVLERVVSLAAPPPRVPIPVRDAMRIAGQRLVVVNPKGEWRDVRATSEMYEHEDGGWHILVIPERGWYRWALTGERCAPIAVPVHLAWIE